MSVYGGFDPGTWQAWSLNLLSQIFVRPGIARGFQVTQTGTPSMAVLATLDPTWSDGVLYLANGGFLRIDAQVQFTISNNTSGLTRTDALVATVDPTNSANTGLAVQANWATGFGGTTNNQFVVALISVANNAASIVNANITMNSAVATITGTSSSGSSTLTASDGTGLSLQDSSSTSTMTLVMTGLTTGVGRSLVLQTTDVSAIGHSLTFDTKGNLVGPHNAQVSIGSATYGDIYLMPGSGNYVYLKSGDGTGVSTIMHDDGLLYLSSGGVYALFQSAGGGAAGRTQWVGTTDPGSSAAEGDVWIEG